MISHYRGFMTFLNDEKDLYQRLIKISKIKYSFKNSTFKRLTKITSQKNYLLELENQKYLIKLQKLNSKVYLQLSRVALVNDGPATIIIDSKNKE